MGDRRTARALIIALALALVACGPPRAPSPPPPPPREPVVVGPWRAPVTPPPPPCATPVACRDACDRDDEHACRALARMQARGIGTRHEVEAGKSLYQRLCERGDGDACWELSTFLDQRTGEGFDAARPRTRRLFALAAAGFARGCDAPDPDPDACHSLSRVIGYGAAPGGEARAARVLARAQRIFARRCEDGDGHACLELGRDLVPDAGLGPADARLADRLLTRACDGGVAIACRDLAWMIWKQEPARARALWLRACEGGDGSGCVDAAAPPPDLHPVDGPARTVALIERACELGGADACLRMGERHERGDGVAQDVARARSFDHRTCDLGDARGCLRAALLEQRAGDEAAGDATFARACELGNQSGCQQQALTARCAAGDVKGCAKLGDYYGANAEVGDYYGANAEPPERERAAALWARACDAGNDHACGQLGLFELLGRGDSPSSEARAAALLERGCEADALACEALVDLLVNATQIPRDLERANAVHDRACARHGAGCPLEAGGR